MRIAANINQGLDPATFGEQDQRGVCDLRRSREPEPGADSGCQKESRASPAPKRQPFHRFGDG